MPGAEVRLEATYLGQPALQSVLLLCDPKAAAFGLDSKKRSLLWLHIRPC